MTINETQKQWLPLDHRQFPSCYNLVLPSNKNNKVFQLPCCYVQWIYLLTIKTIKFYHQRRKHGKDLKITLHMSIAHCSEVCWHLVVCTGLYKLPLPGLLLVMSFLPPTYAVLHKHFLHLPVKLLLLNFTLLCAIHEWRKIQILLKFILHKVVLYFAS